jgi:hypothetical protein
VPRGFGRGDQPIIFDHPDPFQADEDGSATFSVTAFSPDESPLTYQWEEVISGAGFPLTDGGQVSGATTDTLTLNPVTPADEGRQFRCKVCNDAGCTNSNPAGLDVLRKVYFFATYSPFDLEVNQPIAPRDASVGFAGDYTPFTYSLTGDPWPAWVNLDPNTGVITGTPDTVELITGLTITATDANTNTAVSNVFSINVVANIVPVEFIGNIADIVTLRNQPMTVVQTGLEFNGTQTPFTYSNIGTPFPSGVTLNSTNGFLSGTPTDAGVTAGHQIRVVDSDLNHADSNTFSYTVNVVAPVVDAQGPYTGNQGVPTQVTASVTPGTDPAPTGLWTIVSGAATQTNFTPSDEALYTLQFTVTPDDGPPVSDTASFDSSAGPPDPEADLFWHAAYYDNTATPVTYELLAQKKGTGAPAFTHSGLLLPDHEGVYYDIDDNSASWHGARQVTNLCGYSNDITQTAVGAYSWQIANGTIDGPDQATLTATFAGASLKYVTTHALAGLADLQIGDVQTIRFEAKGTAGEVIQVYPWKTPDGGLKSITLTADWVIYSFTVACTEAGRNTSEFNIINDGNVPKTFNIRNVQIESVTGQSNQNPGEFIATSGSHITKYYANANGNTVLNNVVTEAVGAPLAELPSLYAAPALTNIKTYSNDLTNIAGWNVASTATATLDQAGIAGEPNTASLLECITAGTNARAYAAITLTSSGSQVIRVIAKAGTTDWIWVLANAFDASQSAYIDLATPAFGTLAGMDDSHIETVGDWIIAYLEFTTTTDLTGNIHLHIAPANDSVSAAIGDNVTFGNIEVFSGKTIAEVRGAAPIITEGSTVSTTDVGISYDVLNHDDTQGAYYAESRIFSDDIGSTRYLGVLGTGSNGRFFYTETVSNVRAFSGSVSQVAVDWSTNIFLKLGVAYATSDGLQRLTADGVSSTEAAYDGWDSSPSAIYAIKDRTFNSISISELPALIRNIQRWDLPYADAKAKIDELMGP